MNFWGLLSQYQNAVLNTFINLLPDATGSLSLVVPISKFNEFLEYINWYFPVMHMVIVMTAIMTVELLYLNYWVLKRIIRTLTFGLVQLP